MAGYECDRSFDLFGTTVRLLIGPPARSGLPSAEIAAVEVEGFLRGLHKRLTRFEADSELSVMNADPASECAVSPLLALAVRAGLWSAELTDGLVDPTLVDQLERAGYARSRVGVEPAALKDALWSAPRRRAARPHPSARWREISVDQQAGVVRRPPGLRFDTGGSGKGLAADLASGRLANYTMHAVDAGGDIRIGGSAHVPRLVEIENPLGDEPAFEFELADGAVASSGLASRVWRRDDGYAHHLLDPSTGEPAWTGVIQASALADTALEAETIAKAALLSGPERGREILAQRGGVLILDDGSVEPIGLPARTTTSGPQALATA